MSVTLVAIGKEVVTIGKSAMLYGFLAGIDMLCRGTVADLAQSITRLLIALESIETMIDRRSALETVVEYLRRFHSLVAFPNCISDVRFIG